MADHELIVKQLEGIADWHRGKFEQTGEEDYETDAKILAEAADLMRMLLRPYEPAQPKTFKTGVPDGHISWWFVCGFCEYPIDYQDRFCRCCGRPVKWDG